MQTPAAEQLLQQGATDVAVLARVALSYTLTEPGLEAMLRLAQRDLESARFHAALSWLAQAQNHPDFFGRRAAYGHYMAAVALHDLGRDQEALTHAELLRGIAEEDAGGGADAAPLIAQLDAALGAALPALPVVVSVLDHAPAPALQDLVPQAIWSVPLEESLIRRRFRAAQEAEDPTAPQNALDQRLRDADLATAAVTVVGHVASIVSPSATSGRSIRTSAAWA
jgi:hypothetical protein